MHAACPAPLPLPEFPWSRRDLLRVGSLAIASSLLPTDTALASPKPSSKTRSVIFLWMAGGVTHIDGLDPKPEASDQVRGTLRPIDTAVAGIQFAESLPGLAGCADRLAVVRSYVTESDDHFLSQAYA